MLELYYFFMQMKEWIAEWKNKEADYLFVQQIWRGPLFFINKSILFTNKKWRYV